MNYLPNETLPPKATANYKSLCQGRAETFRGAGVQSEKRAQQPRKTGLRHPITEYTVFYKCKKMNDSNNINTIIQMYSFFYQMCTSSVWGKRGRCLGTQSPHPPKLAHVPAPCLKTELALPEMRLKYILHPGT